jgi:hypothetical protein
VSLPVYLSNSVRGESKADIRHALLLKKPLSLYAGDDLVENRRTSRRIRTTNAFTA